MVSNAGGSAYAVSVPLTTKRYVFNHECHCVVVASVGRFR